MCPFRRLALIAVTTVLGVLAVPTVTHADDGRWHARGDVIDLRKNGFVPSSYDIQPAGVISPSRQIRSHSQAAIATTAPTRRSAKGDPK